MRRVIIVGYMGAGKTTIGRALAGEMGLRFYDLDWYIEERMMKTVPQIFDLRGEDGFRLVERNMLREVAEFEDIVLSCGGGTPCFHGNMDYLNAQGDTVYLRATVDVLCAHLGMGGTKRPLLRGKSPEGVREFVTRQLAAREPCYLRAGHVIDVPVLGSKHAIRETVERLLETLTHKHYHEEMDD